MSDIAPKPLTEFTHEVNGLHRFGGSLQRPTEVAASVPGDTAFVGVSDDPASADHRHAREDAAVPVGGIILMASAAAALAPPGYAACTGIAISRTTCAELFAIIGTTYGAGDGVTTFNTPNIPAPVADTVWQIRWRK